MKTGIMQPYFFPYIGYWQLINAVDKYVILDDVNYIKAGWVNRNRILLNGDAKLIGLRLHKASQNKLIKDTEIIHDPIYNKKLLRMIELAYRHAPYFDDAYKVIESVVTQDEKNLTQYLCVLIKSICKYLTIDTELLLSSEIEKNTEMRGQDKILGFCQRLGADEYYNPIGGMSLYSPDVFANQGIALKFLRPGAIQYTQFKNDFIPNLSIIDVMMFNSVEQINTMLDTYELL